MQPSYARWTSLSGSTGHLSQTCYGGTPFFNHWNGFSILRHPTVMHPDFYAQTDASGSWGCAAVFGVHWVQWQWPAEWYKIGIMAKELVPIIFTCIVWGRYLSRHHINFCCDSANLVIAINKGSSKDKFVMHLLCCLSFFVAHFDIYITATYLPGAINVMADHLSRGRFSQAFQVTPTLSCHFTPIPYTAYELISPRKIEWTSLYFHQLFQQTLSLIH